MIFTMRGDLDNDTGEMLEQTKLAAFFLWEYTKFENTLTLWYCTEDIASFLERCHIYKVQDMHDLILLNKNSKEYKAFVRHIAFRIFNHTKIEDTNFNWYTAEKLLNNAEWRRAITYMSNTFRIMRDSKDAKAVDYNILSPEIKNYYGF